MNLFSCLKLNAPFLPTEHWTRAMAITCLLVVGMTGIAFGLPFKEFFFPEMLAIAIGCLWMQHCPWQTNRIRLVVALALGSLIGYSMSLLPIDFYCFKILLSFFLCSLGLILLRINVVPILSAAILPLVIGEVSWVYPLIVTGETALIALISYIFSKSTTVFCPIADSRWRRLKHLLILSPLLMLLLLLCHALGQWLIVPPLIVGFSAFADSRRPVRKQFRLATLLCLLAISLGIGSRWLMYCLVPEGALVLEMLFLVIAVLLFARTCKAVQLFFPPAGALLLLAHFIPASEMTLYLWQAPIGTLLFLGAGRLYSKLREKLNAYSDHAIN